MLTNAVIIEYYDELYNTKTDDEIKEFFSRLHSFMQQYITIFCYGMELVSCPFTLNYSNVLCSVRARKDHENYNRYSTLSIDSSEVLPYS